MCGIFGVLNSTSKQDDNMIRIIKKLMNHRGPDNFGSYYNDQTGDLLCHTRLAILDLDKRSNQPYFFKNGDYILLFNGEIYNHLDLRAQFDCKNIVYTSGSDTETISRLAEYYIENSLKIEDLIGMLNGIFVIVVYNVKNQNLEIYRDRLGVKPLFYFFHDQQLIFASELAVIEQTHGDRLKVSADNICNCLIHNWHTDCLTIYSNVFSLRPGKCLTFQNGELKIGSFISQKKISAASIKSSTSRETDKLEQLLLQSLERQLLSDVPIGFFLSGGVDSSLLVALSKQLGHDPKCFTINGDKGSGDDGEDDLPYAISVARYLDVDLQQVEIEKSEYINNFPKIISIFDRPSTDFAAWNTYRMCQAANNQGIKVMMSGAGADEVFAGYRRHIAIHRAQKLKLIRWLLPNADKLTWLPNGKFKRRIIKLRGILNSPDFKKYAAWTSEQVVRQLFTSHSLKYNISEQLVSNKDDTPLSEFLRFERTQYLSNHNLHYSDLFSMRASIELRVPYLDNDIVEYGESLDDSFLIKRSTSKYILKKVAERYLPKNIVYRKKVGFGGDTGSWADNYARNWISKRESLEKLQSQSELWNPIAVLNLLQNKKFEGHDLSYLKLSVISALEQIDAPKS